MIGSEKNAGLTFPGFFGLLANRYMHESGATKEHLANVVLTKSLICNKQLGLAQFQKPTTMEERLCKLNRLQSTWLI